MVDKLGTTVLGETNVEEEDGLENPVEGNPVKDGVTPELNHRKDGVNNPVGEELSVVCSWASLKSNEGVVTRDNEGGKVCKQLSNTTKIEEDKEEVEDSKSNDSVSLGDASLGLNLLEERVFFQLLKYQC